jgi:hypothetical protein
LKKRGRDSLKKIEQYLVDKNLGLPPGFDLSFQARGENSPLLQEFVGNYLDGAKSVFIHSPWIKKGALDAIISRLGNRAKVGVRCLPLKANVDVLNEYPNIAKGISKHCSNLSRRNKLKEEHFNNYE